jgi:hypothetical protein
MYLEDSKQQEDEQLANRQGSGCSREFAGKPAQTEIERYTSFRFDIETAQLSLLVLFLGP